MIRRRPPAGAAALLAGLALAAMTTAAGAGAEDGLEVAAGSTSNPKTGRAFVVSGADGSLLLTLAAPDRVHLGMFGHAVAGLGDVNGDGVPDLAVGAPRVHDAAKRVGRVYIFSGSDGALLRTIVSPGQAKGERFGWAVAGTGDLDGDGAGDLVVGSPRARTPGRGRTGEAYLVGGGTGAVLGTLSSPTLRRGARFGWSVAAGRDVSGDAVGDVLVGAPNEKVGSRRAQGRVYLFSGDPNAATLLREIDDPRPQAIALFGESLAFTDDVDGDGAPDLVVGADGQHFASGDFAGRVFLISGADPNAAPLLDRESPIPEPFANFGFSVTGLPDLDADGKGDFAASAPDQTTTDPFAGLVYVLGSAAGTRPVLAFLDDPEPHRVAFLGGSIAALPDLTGDGRPEIAVGSELHRDPGFVRAGRVYVFEAASGTVHLQIESPTGDVCARFGWSVAPAGDLDDDGVEEILVGAPFHRETPRAVIRRCF